MFCLILPLLLVWNKYYNIYYITAQHTFVNSHNFLRRPLLFNTLFHFWLNGLLVLNLLSYLFLTTSHLYLLRKLMISFPSLLKRLANPSLFILNLVHYKSTYNRKHCIEILGNDDFFKLWAILAPKRILEKKNNSKSKTLFNWV